MKGREHWPVGTVARVIAVTAAVAYSAYYLYWRVVAGTVDLRVWYLSIPLFLVEGFAFYQLVVALGRIRADEHLALTQEDMRRAVAACSLERECASVDVLIPTYDEPIEVLTQTIRAARDIDYPHETYVLDDGARPWLSETCAEEGVRYVTRQDRSHFKAGNINHGLEVSTGEYIVVLDADFIALPNLISALLPYFSDEKVALVQSPQAFYNLDSFQHAGRGRWNDQTHFFRTILPAKARSNSAFWCGTPAMLRRSALASIGGVSTYSVTEDIETSLILLAHGWRIAYHNATLALGLAPSNVEGFMTQRLRWGRGVLSLLFSRRFNPFTIRGLSLRQRLSYLESMTYWLQGWLYTIEYLMPPIVLVTGLSPIVFTVTPVAFLARWSAFLVATVVASYLASPRTFRPLATSMFRPLWTMVHLAAGFDALRHARPSFKVTSKSLNARSVYVPFLVAAYVTAAVMLASVAYRVLRQLGVIPGPVQSSAAFWLAGGFAVYFAVMFILLGRRMWQAARERRRHFRASIRESISGRLLWSGMEARVSVHNLSAEGALLSGNPDELFLGISAGTQGMLELALPEGGLRAPVVLRDVSSSPGTLFLGVEFGEMAEADSQRLEAHLLSRLAPEERRYDDAWREI